MPKPGQTRKVTESKAQIADLAIQTNRIHKAAKMLTVLRSKGIGPEQIYALHQEAIEATASGSTDSKALEMWEAIAVAANVGTASLATQAIVYALSSAMTVWDDQVEHAEIDPTESVMITHPEDSNGEEDHN